MSRHRVGILVVGVLALGVATAVATPPTGFTRTELARSTIAGPIAASATGASDVAGQKITFEPGAAISWHSHPGASFVAVKSGTLTLYHGGPTGCTSQSYSAGQGFLEPADDVHYAKNEGSTPAESYSTRVAVPVGAELRKTETNPGGANCPADAAPTGVARTDLARSTIAEPITVSATAASDVAMQTITVEPGGSAGWHSHPGATFVAVKSGTLTLYHGNAQGCTSKGYSAGQGFLEPAGDVHVGRNEGTTPVEAYVTFLAVPVGGALRSDQQSPSGTNCPERVELAAVPQLPRTGGTGPAALLATLGLCLAGAGTAARVLARRR